MFPSSATLSPSLLFAFVSIPDCFSALTAHEQGLYEALRADPFAAEIPAILADAAEDNGTPHRAALLRQQSRLALQELLRGRILTEADCASILAHPGARSLWASEALGFPATATLPDLHTLEGVRAQYEAQVLLLAFSGFLAQQGKALGIVGIDDRFKTIPPLEDIQKRLRVPALQQKIDQGFNQLLLVPFALPLLPKEGSPSLVEGWRQGVLRIICDPGYVDTQKPVEVSSRYLTEDLVYWPRQIDQDHGGRTKAALLADGIPGWDVLLIEGDLREFPCRGEGRVIGGRRQVERYYAPYEYLRDLPPREIGWTPETYIISFLDLLEREGAILDWRTCCFLLGALFPRSYDVPLASWNPGAGRAELCDRDPSFAMPSHGTRLAVRVTSEETTRPQD